MAEGRRTETYAGKGPKISAQGAAACCAFHGLGASGRYEGEFCVEVNKKGFANRIAVWDRLYAKQQAEIEKKPRKPITITLPDGATKEGTSWQTTPLEIAKSLSKKLAEDVVVAKVLYTEAIESEDVAADPMKDDDEDEQVQKEPWELFDLHRPLEGSCKLELLKFDSAEGKDTFWHSSAHILGNALEEQFGGFLTIGPPLDNGFYYDIFAGKKKVTQEDFPKLEQAMTKLAKQNAPFERLVLTKEEALELFADNPFKVTLISEKVPDGGKASAYRCGPLIDWCRGPHVTTTAKMKACWLNKNSAAYWLGKATNDSLQRVYGVSFPSDKELKQYQKFLEEAEKYDHRNVGKQQGLYMFHSTVSPGSCFWSPMGARIYNKLIEFIRAEYRIRGFEEVVTPNIFSCDLWKVSGHYQNYKDDMFIWEIEGEEWGLKPMNCPANCEIFRSTTRSYRELPLRWADFGVLHRNEKSGALTGLTRVRRFQQDDGHIFCRHDQIKDEVVAALDFLTFVYDIFGYEFDVYLSTRPKKALGAGELWDKAEAALAEALQEFKKKVGKPWGYDIGGGAFYGPKIDIKLKDALGRTHQCGTIQLDFQLPIRFNLQYRSENATEEEVKEEQPKDGVKEEEEQKKAAKEAKENKAGEYKFVEGKLRSGNERPVIIHRAVLGSIERFTSIMVEHFKGKLPMWLSPRQIMVVPISEAFVPYAEYIYTQLHRHGLHSELDKSNATLNKKIRGAQLDGWCYQAIVGAQEEESLSVNLRSRDSPKPIGSFRIDELLAKLKTESMPSSQKLDVIDAWKDKSLETFAPPPRAEAGKGEIDELRRENEELRRQLKQANSGAPAVKMNGAATPDKKAGPGLQRQGSLQLRKQNSRAFADISVEEDLESFLEDHPYVGGFEPSKRDAELFDQMECAGQIPESPGLQRWYDLMSSTSKMTRSSW